MINRLYNTINTIFAKGRALIKGNADSSAMPQDKLDKSLNKSIDRLMISIVDDNGTRQFSMHRLAQRILLFIGIGIGAITILYIIMAHFLMSRLEVILENNMQVRENFQNIYEQNSELERRIDYRTNELLKVSSKVNELETIIGVQESSNEVYNNDDIDIESLSPMQKDMILKIVPNGNPVDGFAMRSFPNKHTIAYEMAKTSPIIATANGIIDSVRVAGTNNHIVQIRHSYGFISNFTHISKVIVKSGDFVSKGQVIGYSVANSTLQYDARFMDSSLDMQKYADWNSEQFGSVVSVNGNINWKSLVWALDDIIQLKNYRISYQNDDEHLQTNY